MGGNFLSENGMGCFTADDLNLSPCLIFDPDYWILVDLLDFIFLGRLDKPKQGPDYVRRNENETAPYFVDAENGKELQSTG